MLLVFVMETLRLHVLQIVVRSHWEIMMALMSRSHIFELDATQEDLLELGPWQPSFFPCSA